MQITDELLISGIGSILIAMIAYIWHDTKKRADNSVSKVDCLKEMELFRRESRDIKNDLSEMRKDMAKTARKVSFIFGHLGGREDDT